jgi:perosamine synthetase
MRNQCQKYEEAFAALYCAKKAFSFWKGRVGLYAVLKALGVGPDDEVILPGYTCIMDVNPILYLGAKAVFVDIEPDTFNMDATKLEEKITPRTRLIIVQHTYGYVADLDKVLSIADRRKILVIEDCCLALGSKYKGKLAGTFTPVAYFSSQWNKTYTTGLGGMVICNESGMADKIQEICEREMMPAPFMKTFLLAGQLCLYRAFTFPKTTGVIRKCFRWMVHHGLLEGSSSFLEISEPQLPENFFMDMSWVQASSGLNQLRRLDKNIEHRKILKQFYDKLLQQHGWQVIKPPANTDPVLVRYPVRITEKEKAVQRATEFGIELGAWFEQPLHPKEANMDLYGYKWGSCPQGEKAAREVVNLPLHHRVTEKTARQTLEFLCQFKQSQ